MVGTIYRENIVTGLGHNLTDRFGIGQLPEELIPWHSYQTISQSCAPLFVLAGNGYLSISDALMPNASACFGVQARPHNSDGSFVSYALYSRRRDQTKHPDFQNQAREFLINSFRYLEEIMAIPILGVVIDLNKNEFQYAILEAQYKATNDLRYAIRQTWVGPIILDDLGFTHVTASPHSLGNITNQSSIDVYFTSKPLS